jgi:hypothetical protein
VAAKRRKIPQSAAVITHENFSKALDELKKRPTTLVTAQTAPTSSGDVDDNYGELPIPPLLDHCKKLIAKKSINMASATTSVGLPKEDDFVLLSFQPQGRNRHRLYYVGHVVRCLENGLWEIQCMRRHSQMSTQTFHFTEKDDLEMYTHDDIIMLLPAPKIVKNIYHFSVDLSKYQSYLR